MKLTIYAIIIFGVIIPRAYCDTAYVNDYNWDAGKGRLEYTLTADAVIRVRAGSPSGPLYQTLINMGNRKAGLNTEYWDGKDPGGNINFNDYGPLIFSIDTETGTMPDDILLVEVENSPEAVDPSVIMCKNKIFKAIVDIPLALKQDFIKSKTELKIFVDNKLVEHIRNPSYPYALELILGGISEGRHLLTINCFQKTDEVCAYKNMIVDVIKDAPRVYASSIVYSVYIEGFWQIAALNLNDLKQTILTSTPVDKSYPVWSPDGARLAYVTNTGELWIMDALDKKSAKVSFPIKCAEPKWSPDGRKIMFTSYTDIYFGDTEIWEVELSTNKLRKLINRPWAQYQPDYSPNGKEIVFVDGPEFYSQEIRKLNIEAGEVTQLTENNPLDYDLYPAYNFSGEKIYYCSNQSGNYDIWVMDKYGRNNKNITKAPSHNIRPVPAGKFVYFLSDRTGSQQIWKMRIDGKKLTQITDEPNGVKDISAFISKN